MIELLKQLGIISIGSFTIVGLVGYLTKNLFEKFLETKIDAYKRNLDKELEVFKAELDKQSYEFQVKFSNLHVERAQLTKELYKKLKDFYGKMKRVHRYANMLPPPKLNDEIEVKLLTELRDSYIALSETFEENKIIFSKSISGKLSELTSSYWNHEFIYQKVRIYEHMQEIDKSEELKTETEKRYKELYEIHYDRIPGILVNIEDEFRRLLGVEK